MKHNFQKKIEKKYLVFFGWIILSLLVTIYSKWLMNKYFPYPTIMSCVHMIIASILSHSTTIVMKDENNNLFSTSYELNCSEKKSILIFSLIVALNIWVSNASLHLASISLHQVARTTIPLFTMLIGILFFKHKYRLSQLPSVLLVILGVAITVNGNPELTIYGISIVLFGCCVSSLKGILAQKLQMDSIKIGPISMLQYVAPVASLTLLLFSVILGEMNNLIDKSENIEKIQTIKIAFFLVFAGFLAFILNILSFKSSSIVSPLAMNIAGNVKQLLTCIIGCLIFGNPITEKLLIGIFLTGAGAFWYSFTKQNEVNQKRVKYMKGRYIDRVEIEKNIANQEIFENKLIQKHQERKFLVIENDEKNNTFESVNNFVHNEEKDEISQEIECISLKFIHEEQDEKSNTFENDEKEIDLEDQIEDNRKSSFINKTKETNSDLCNEETNKENFTENFQVKIEPFI